LVERRGGFALAVDCEIAEKRRDRPIRLLDVGSGGIEAALSII
jgi:hypothetical protein